MGKRQIVRIDQEKCDGCGLCVPSCAEGAIQIVDGKAQLSEDKFCDGLGACLGECPQGALTIEEREAEEFVGPAPGAQAHHPAPRLYPRRNPRSSSARAAACGSLSGRKPRPPGSPPWATGR